MSRGLRDWRGQIIQTNVACSSTEATVAAATLNRSSSNDKEEKSALFNKERNVMEIKLFRKDEFGRDVEAFVDEKRHTQLKREREEDDDKKEQRHLHKHKKHKRHRDKSSGRFRTPSPRGRLVGTPPPPDPFRPQMDERRCNRSQRRQHEKNRSRSKSYSCHGTQRRSHDEEHSRRGRYRRRNSSWSRSRSRGRNRSRSRNRSRGRNRSQSPPSSRSGRRRSSASVERKWAHNAFDDRSPSPPREPDPFYRPEPEAWASRAGGVYLPRK